MQAARIGAEEMPEVGTKIAHGPMLRARPNSFKLQTSCGVPAMTDGVHTDFQGAMSYGDYLGLADLVGVQKPRSEQRASSSSGGSLTEHTTALTAPPESGLQRMTRAPTWLLTPPHANSLGSPRNAL